MANFFRLVYATKSGTINYKTTYLGIISRKFAKKTTPIPPVARKLGYKATFGATLMNPPKVIQDPYNWMKNEKKITSGVKNHIKLENNYTEEMTSHLQDFEEELLEEFVSRRSETQPIQSYPYMHGKYVYFQKNNEDNRYPTYYRYTAPTTQSSQHIGNLDTAQVVLDINQLANDQDFCDVYKWDPEPLMHNLIAVAVDYTDMRSKSYEIIFVDVESGQQLEDKIRNTSGNFEWGKDQRVLYYTASRNKYGPKRLYRHTLGTPAYQDECLFEEEDEELSVSVKKTSSGRFIVMEIGEDQEKCSEAHVIDLESNNSSLKLIQQRLPKVFYSVEHWREKFLILTNIDGASENKLVSTLVSHPSYENWQDTSPYISKKTLEKVFCFENHIVLSGRFDGLPRWWVLNPHNLEHQDQLIQMPEELYSVKPGVNRVYASSIFNFTYSSLTSPPALFSYDMKDKRLSCMFEEKVFSYDRSKYKSERHFLTVRDGTSVPVYFVYRKDIYPEGVKNGPMPLLLFAYGSYGYSMDPEFDYNRLSFLDRGVVWCMAHVRGGGEMGYSWHEQGKFLAKKNSFYDFCDCLEGLLKQGWTTKNQIALYGRSAGGLLICATVNMRPDLCKIAVTDAPFVDVMNTLKDSAEFFSWKEWGNPNEKQQFMYLLEYSPYNNVSRQAYPFILLTGRLRDPIVGYWEPCKLAARLRERKTNNNPVLLKICMNGSNHATSLKESAFHASVILDQLNAKSKKAYHSD